MRELVSRLVRLDGDVEYTLFVDFDAAEAPALPAGARVVHVPTTAPAERAASAADNRSLADLWMASKAMSDCDLDVVLFPSLHTFTPVRGGARVAVVIHDVIPELFPGHVFPNARSRVLWRLKSWAARRQAQLIITVSEASKRALCRQFGLEEDRIAVAREATDALFQPAPRGDESRGVLERWQLCDDGFILYVGGFSPHKNLDTLIAAFAALVADARWSGWRLVLAGDYEGDVFHSCYEELRRMVERTGLSDNVVFTGYVSDATLVHLYTAAAVVALPSMSEGFGLPALEAMACGTPVIASAGGALPEVVGDAGLLLDAVRPAELKAAFERVLSDPALRERLGRAAQARAATFSWERAADTVSSALRDLAGRGARR